MSSVGTRKPEKIKKCVPGPIFCVPKKKLLLQQKLLKVITTYGKPDLP